MRKLKSLLIVIMVFISITSLMAQTRTIEGKVTSLENGSPISDVTVKLKGANTISTTNADGVYSISVDAKSTETLIFNHLNFEEMEVVAIGKSQLDISLTSNIRYNQYGQVVNRIPLESEARDGIITFESKDKSFKFWTDIRLNIDFTKHFTTTITIFQRPVMMQMQFN